MDFLGRADTFVRIVEGGSLSSAARLLRLSLAAVSRQMTSLEEELGAELFVRTSRRMQMTEAGQRFYEHAVRLVRDAEMAKQSVRAEQAIAGSVVISASVSLGVLRIVPMLPKLIKTYPRIELSLRLEDRATDLIVEGVDIAVRAGMALPDTPHLIAQLIATFRPFVVVSPAYIERHGLPLEIDSLTAHAAIVGPDSPEQWRFVEGETERLISVTPKIRIGTLLGQLTAVRAGLGVAALPDFVIEEDLRSGALQSIRFAAELAPIVVYALVRADARKSPRIRAVVEHLAQTVPLGLGDKKTPNVL